MKKALIVLFLISSHCIFSQINEVGVFLGGSVYNGTIDITAGNFLQQTKMSYGIFANYALTDKIKLRAQLNGIKLYADEKKYPSSSWREQRALNFNTKITELSLNVDWTLFSFGEPVGSNNLGKYSFYVLGGVGGAFFTPQPFYYGNNTPDSFASDYTTTTTNQSTFVIPIGAGARWQIDEKWAISGEIIGRKTYSPYIDGIKVATSKSNDFYYTGGLLLSYTFGNSNGGHNNQKGGKNLGSGCPRF